MTDIATRDKIGDCALFKGRRPPLQLVLMGCPGSGKSFTLKQMADIAPANVFRTTFHSEMSYGDFVGAYKPVPLYVTSSSQTFNADGSRVEGERAHWTPVVKYDYRPGPFINAYVRAMRNPDQDIVLIVDEVNRANPAAVFGDLIQLLDRDESGWSEYSIDAADDLRSFLAEHLSSGFESLRLPPNFFIWATMNRADESVNFVDSAFLRRWQLVYLPYATPCSYGADPVADGRLGNWDSLRRKINEKLAVIEGIEDDKFIGPYFLKRHELKDPQAIFAKLVTYLWHDVVSMEREKVFERGSLGALYERWMNGKNILKL